MKKTLKAIIYIFEVDPLGNKSLYTSYESNTFNNWNECMKVSEREATFFCKELNNLTKLKYKHYVKLMYVEPV